MHSDVSHPAPSSTGSSAAQSTVAAGHAAVAAGFHRLTVSAAVTSLIVIAVGGAVRATDSGLACPTWPGCFSGGDFLPPAGLNIWLEHSHRLLAGALAVQIAALTVWVLARYRHVPDLLWPALVSAIAVNAQALLGALVVWNLLQAELVTAHLGLGTLVMALMIYLAIRSRWSLRWPRSEPAAGVARFAAVTLGVTWLQVLIGGHLTGVHGGLAFRADPLLGLFSLGPLSVEPEIVNLLHRAASLVVAGLVMALSARVRRAGVGGWPRRFARLSVWLVVVQIGVGVANLASNLSFLSVIPHLAVASWILASLVMVFLGLLRTRAPHVGHVPASEEERPATITVGA